MMPSILAGLMWWLECKAMRMTWIFFFLNGQLTQSAYERINDKKKTTWFNWYIYKYVMAAKYVFGHCLSNMSAGNNSLREQK